MSDFITRKSSVQCRSHH